MADIDTPETAPVRTTRAEPIVLREFPAVSKYRLRLLKSSPGKRGVTVLDIREYAKGETFEGFTRRGIRLHSIEEARTLIQCLRAVEEDHLLRD